MPGIIALDPGRSTGVAYVADYAGTVQFTTWKLHGVDGERTLHLRALLTELHAVERFERVVYEAPWQGPNVNAVRALRHYESEIQSWAEAAGLPAASAYTPKEIKAGIAGGNASKERMIQTVRWLGHPVSDEHQADAVALLLLAQRVSPAGVRRKAAKKAAAKLAKAADLFGPPGRRKRGMT